MRKASAVRWCASAVAASALVVGVATASDAGASVNHSEAASASCWATALSASQCGGMSALIAAAKAESNLTVTTDPPTWANYGNIIK
ncbi:MAG TPA: hypothetical protein VMD59_20280, partial [Acidimicrobiales bacterium]|nr:hypothetical protein [Acidimicrobiales bacterium]